MSNSGPLTPDAPDERRAGRRRRGVWKWTRRLLLLVAAGIAAGLLTLGSIDLGPHVRAWAEKGATDYLERPMHIGRVKALLWPGLYELDDVKIEGLEKTDRPFLTARRLVVNLGWRSLLRPHDSQLFVDVHMSEWSMTIETWAGRHSLPKITPKGRSSSGKNPFTVTVNVYATGGQFSYYDNSTPWSVTAPNLNFSLVRAENLNAYVGTAHFEKGVVQIQDFLPMSAELTTRFTLDGPHVILHHIDLLTDGARSSLTGEVFLGGDPRPGEPPRKHWPEQTYHVDSQINFSRMRELFFAKEPWRVSGTSHFVGTFHIPQDGPRELKGTFASELATLDTPDRRLTFPQLYGSLLWLPDRFTVTDAGADFNGGRATFSYALAPLGTPHPANATFIADYEGVDLEAFRRAILWQDMDLRGRASGHNEMRWVNGQLGTTKTGAGRIVVAPPPSVALQGATLAPSQPVVATAPGPFQRDRPLGPLPIGGEIAYRYDSTGLDLDSSWVASPTTFVGFQGRADFADRSRLPFHVTSGDWQESDRILAGILTASGAPSGAVPVGGFGTFDGQMTESFSQPRVEGRFAGDAVRSWDVTWGRVVGDIVIQNQYVTVANGTIGDADHSIVVDGRFSLGFRARGDDVGELKDVHVRVAHWPLNDFRQAFDLNDWPIEGTVEAADIRLQGPYHGPFGSGLLRIDRGTAWGETFETVGGEMNFIGSGLQISHIAMAKDVGRVTGSAVLKWDGTYAFDTLGEKVPVESLTSFTVPKAPLSGVLQFHASGQGLLSAPTYEFKGTVPDLSAGDQGIGAVSGVLQVRDKTLFIQQLEADSMLLKVSGSGSIALNEAYDATMTFRFSDSRIDPYLPLISPKVAESFSKYTRATVRGVVQVQGELKNPAALGLFATIEQADLTLFDYHLTNDGDIKLQFENNVATISHLALVGLETSLAIEGEVPFSEAPMRITAKGQANLAILHSRFPDLASAGVATINATIGGTPQQVTLSGQAAIADGRLRYRSFPHGLEQINGPITFDVNRLSIGRDPDRPDQGNEFRARMGDGDVTFWGALELKGLVPDQFSMKAAGRAMTLRFPSGFRSTVNANLTLTGPVASPTLGGEVSVIRSTYALPIDSDAALLGLAGFGAMAGSVSAASASVPIPESTTPMKLDVRIQAPANTLSVRTADVQVSGQATLNVRGTIDAPSVLGQVTLDRGNIFFNGNHYLLQPSMIFFSNASRIEPVFDVTLSTRARVPGQTFDVTFRVSGPAERMDLQLTSDPYLPQTDLVLVLLGERPDLGSAELRSVQSPQIAQQQAVRTLFAQLTTIPFSSRIGSVVQRTIPFDTFSLVPLLGSDAALQALSPGARLTLGKRISDRVFLTYSRALNASRQYDIILLEYEQSDRISWVLSRNEDRTFALDFRVRHVF